MPEAAGVLVCAGMRGGAKAGAGISGTLEDRQGCGAKAAPGPPPALVTVPGSAMPGGGPSPWPPCGRGLVRSRERVLDRLISSANCSNLGLLSCYLWSGHISVKLHLLQGCISFSFAFPLHGGVGGCVHFLLVLPAVHLPGTKNR